VSKRTCRIRLSCVEDLLYTCLLFDRTVLVAGVCCRWTFSKVTWLQVSLHRPAGCRCGDLLRRKLIQSICHVQNASTSDLMLSFAWSTGCGTGRFETRLDTSAHPRAAGPRASHAGRAPCSAPPHRPAAAGAACAGQPVRTPAAGAAAATAGSSSARCSRVARKRAAVRGAGPCCRIRSRCRRRPVQLSCSSCLAAGGGAAAALPCGRPGVPAVLRPPAAWLRCVRSRGLPPEASSTAMLAGPTSGDPELQQLEFESGAATLRAVADGRPISLAAWNDFRGEMEEVCKNLPTSQSIRHAHDVCLLAVLDPAAAAAPPSWCLRGQLDVLQVQHVCHLQVLEHDC